MYIIANICERYYITSHELQVKLKWNININPLEWQTFKSWNCLLKRINLFIKPSNLIDIYKEEIEIYAIKMNI